MPRYPEALIEQIKREAPIQDWLESKGHAFASRGSEQVCRCPFPEHEDKTPSFAVSADKNLWNCLGACGTGGTVIDLVMRLEGCAFREAVEILIAAFPFAASEATTTPGQHEEKEKDAELFIINDDMNDSQALSAVVRFYAQQLPKNSEASAYLAMRGISQEAITHFKIGVADRAIGLQIPNAGRKAGKAIRETLQRIGMFRSSGHEAFTGRIIIPIFDAAGHVVHVYGRKFSDGAMPHCYRAGSHAGVFNLRGLQKASADTQNWCIVCESIIDAITFWAAGFQNVTCAYGTNGFTAAILETIQTQKYTNVFIAFDRDQAGDAAAEIVADQLHDVGISGWRVPFPHGMDVNSYAMSTKPATKVLGIALRAAQWMGAGDAPLSPLECEDAPKTQTCRETEKPRVEDNSETNSNTHTKLQVDDSGSCMWVCEENHYRVQGLRRFRHGIAARVTLALQGPGGCCVDTVELYQRKQREAFADAARDDCNADKMQVRKDLSALLHAIEHWAAEETPQEGEDPVAAMPPSQRAAAEDLLRDPDLVDRSIKDLARCGLIGEEPNKLIGLVAVISRKMRRPLALLIQSLSGAGKTALMEGVLAFVPEEDRIQYSAMTGRSVFYLGDTDLKHKVLALVEEEGAQQAGYALKLLQSEGKLNIASTGKDPQTGRMVTHDYTVEGPIMLMLTTTAAEIDDELQNRCLVVGVDEARSQTSAVHDQQRLHSTLHGLLQNNDHKNIRQLHQNAQRLLRSIPVVNPYAEHLTFPDHQTRLRRDHAKYLGIIEAVTLWHQFQREVKSVEHDGQKIEYIETTLADIALANGIAHQVLGRSVDELAPQTRRLLCIASAFVRKNSQQLETDRHGFRFTRRALRESCGWSDSALKHHVARLVELEYFIPHREGRSQVALYELAWDGDPENTAPQFGGLMDVAELERTHG